MTLPTYTIPNLDDAINGVSTALTRQQMLNLGWAVEPEVIDSEPPFAVLVPEHIRVPDIFRCPRCYSSWPRWQWFDHVLDVRAVAQFPEDFLCTGCLRTEFIYGGYLRSQWLTDIGAPPAAVAAMQSRRPIQHTGQNRTPPTARPPGQRPPPGRR